MRVQVLLCGLLLSLAGCSDSGGNDATGTEPLDADDAAGPNATASLEPTVAQVSVRLEGNLGTSAFACEYQTLSTCHRLELAAGETDILHEQPGATLVGVTLTLEWDAPTAVTDTLGIGFMRMGDNFTLVDEVEGTSPLTIEADGLDLLLGEDDLLHAYVYNARTYHHEPPLLAYATIDQPFTVEATFTFQT